MTKKKKKKQFYSVFQACLGGAVALLPSISPWCHQDRRRRLMELAAELFPLQLSGCCAVLRPPQLLAHPPVGVDDAASISDISHCCLAEVDRRRSQHCFIFCCFVLFLNSGFILMCLVRGKRKVITDEWNKVLELRVQRSSRNYFSPVLNLDSELREKKTKKKKTWDIKEFFLLFFFQYKHLFWLQGNTFPSSFTLSFFFFHLLLIQKLHRWVH